MKNAWESKEISFLELLIRFIWIFALNIFSGTYRGRILKQTKTKSDQMQGENLKRGNKRNKKKTKINYTNREN